MIKPVTNLGKYLMLMGRVFSRPERFRMYFKQYLNEMVQLGINSIGIVLLISFFIGAVICIQIKLNIESPWMPRFVVGYTTREILLLEFCTGNYGSKLSLLSDSSKDSGIDDHDSFSGDFQYFCGSDRGFLYSLVCRYHECDGFGIWFTVLLCGMVYLV